MKETSHIIEKNGKFFVTYNATYGCTHLFFGLLFCAFCILLGIKYDFPVPFLIFMTVFSIIFIISFPHAINNIVNGNKGIHWGGDFDGVFLVPPSTERSIYSWSELRGIKVVKKLRYPEHYEDAYNTDTNVVLMHVDKLRNPISGKHTNLSGWFDRKNDGSKVLLWPYPKNEEKYLIEVLTKYSKGSVKIEEFKYLDYEFKE